MKTFRAVGVIGLASLVLAACGAPETVPSDKDELLFIRHASGVAAVDAGASAPAFSRRGALPSGDWSTFVRATINDGRTRVAAENSTTGRVRWERILPGRFYLKAASRDGSLVALGPRGERNYGLGRATTLLTIIDAHELEPQTLELSGNFEPEAFSTDGRSLFVVKYLPARAPTRYQVRMVDIATGREQPVYTPDAHLQTAMGGTARIQAASPEGDRLYTLYTLLGAGDAAHAFIHVLDLDGKWAHCIDLPGGFTQGAETKTALAVSPDGHDLYVGNAATATVAKIDTRELAVTGTGDVFFGVGGRARAAHGPGSTVVFGSGRRITAIDAADLSERRTWDFAGEVKGIQVTRESPAVYVGLRDRIHVVDVASGERVRSFDPPGVGAIHEFGPVMPSPPDAARRTGGCACVKGGPSPARA
jgi:hypothetical protein